MNNKVINGVIITVFIIIMMIFFIYNYNIEKNDSEPNPSNGDSGNGTNIIDIDDLEIINKNFNPQDEPDKYIKKSSFNTYKNYQASTGDIANLYYQHFKLLYLNNKEEAFKKIKSLPDEYVLERESKVINYQQIKSEEEIYLEDNTYRYIFSIDAVLDYTVKIEKLLEE